MENIIDFLLSNIYVLIALFVFLSGLFGKKKEQGKRGKPSPLGRPDTKPSQPEQKLDWPVDWNDWEEDEWEKRATISEQEVEQQESKRKVHLADPQPWQAEQVEEPTLLAPVDDEVRPSKKPTLRSSSSGSQTSPLPSLNKNKVVEGIIWSQVLNKPRAKEPFHSQRTSTIRRS